MKDISDFLKEVNNVCEKYNFSIAHEDGHGAFIITDFDEIYKENFNQAFNQTK
jgi:hypothetical protein